MSLNANSIHDHHSGSRGICAVRIDVSADVTLISRARLHFSRASSSGEADNKGATARRNAPNHGI